MCEGGMEWMGGWVQRNLQLTDKLQYINRKNREGRGAKWLNNGNSIRIQEIGRKGRKPGGG